MKKVLRKVLVSVLCFSVIFSYSFYAFADDGVDNDVTDSTPVAAEDISTDASDADISSEETGEVPSISEDEGLGDSEGTEEGTEEDAVTDEDTADSNQEAIPEEEPQTLTATADDGANVTIEADAGVLPEGATVKANAIGFFGKLGMKSAIKEAVEENDAELVEFKAYDITIYSGDEAVQPNGKVSVSITGTGLESEGNVYHVSDDNSVAEPVEGSASADEAEFTTDHFSIYVVTGENSPALATYVFMNGDEEVSTQIVKNGESLVEPKVPEKDGYKFVGWFNGEKEFTSFGNVSVTKTENVTLTARFAEAHYVYFMDRNGQSVAVTKEGVKGQSITTSDVVLGNIGADEAVTGWYYDEGLTKPVDGSITIGTENIKVYPKVEKGHWITFETDGGTYIAPVFYANGVNTAAPSDPVRIGYTFKEWIDKDGNAFTFGKTLDSSIELAAKWTPANANYTVIYWHENADDNNYSYKESVSKTGLTGERAVYDEKSYEGFTFERADDLEIAGDGSTIVNVYYSRNEYTVTWGAKTKTLVCGKNEHRHNDSCYKYELTCTNTNWWHVHNYWCYTKVLKCTKEEHRHTNSCYEYDAEYTVTAKHGAYIGDKWPGGSWFVKGNSGKAQSLLEVMPLGGTSFGSQALQTGRYVATYNVESIDGNSLVVHHQDSINENWNVTDEERYALVGFTYVDSINIGGKTYESTANGSSYGGSNFYYTRNSYDLVFINNGDEKKESVKYQADISNKGYTPEKPEGIPDGYVFSGWYDNQYGEGTKYDFKDKTMPAKAITLYAKWAAPAYTVTAHTSSGNVSIHVGYGQKIDQTELPKCSEEGKTFSGWATMDANGNYVIFNLNTRIYADTDIYPIFISAGESYTVTYKINAAADSEMSVDDNLYLAGSQAAIKQNMFAVNDKVFLGWTGSDGNTYQPGDKITVTGDVTLTAIWGDKPETVSVTYKANGGTGTDVVVTGLANNSLVENKTATQCGFSKAGYTFAGWGKTADATVDIFANDAEVRVDSNGSNTLYAIWKANENTAYTVEYYYQKDGAYPATTEKSVSRTGTTGAPVDVTAEDMSPTEDGYVFDAANASNVLSGTVAGNGSLVLKVYFKQQFTVTYKPGDHGTFTEQITGSLDYGADTPEGPDATGEAGYTFVDWSPEVADTVTGNAVYTATWTANTDTAYTVKYYYQKDGKYSETADKSDPRTGTTGEPVNVTAEDKISTEDGYVFDAANASNVLSGTVAGDGSLVLKVYFKQQFTVKYLRGDHGTFTEQTTRSLDYDAKTPAAPTVTGDAGYTFTGWSPEVAETVKSDAIYVAQWTETTDSIYIYVQVQGIFDNDISTKYGLTQPANPTGNNWYVIGVSSHAVAKKATEMDRYSTVALSIDDRNKILNKISERYNTGFDVLSGEIAWNNFLKVEDGAGSISSDNPFVYNGTNAYHLDGILTLTNYTVKYVDEDTGKEIADSETVNNVAVPATISAATYSSKSIDGYVQTSTSDDLSLTVENATGADSNREIIIYYSEDVLSDPDEDKDPEKQGDGIPDKYQDTVTYKVENGAWNDESTSDVSEVVTFKLDGKPSNDGDATAQLSHVPGYGDKPAAGYIKSGSWTPRTPETVQKAEDVREFTYTYRREEVVPVDPIVPPFTPESVYTVTYMDGVDDEVVFEDQSTTNLKKGDKTPAFTGELVREGYKFIGWSPEVAETVSGDAVYYAQWEKLPEEPSVVDPSGDNDPIDDGKDIDAQPNGDADTEAKGVKTGDETMLAMWGALGLLAALGLGGALVIGRRREE